eukprot:s865_g9.t1
MGLLASKLGCEIKWRGEEVELTHPLKGAIKVHQVNGCPQISRLDALDLIQEIEEKAARRLPEVLFTMEQPASPKAYNSEVVSWWDTEEGATMMDQPKDVPLEGDEPKIEAEKDEEPEAVEDRQEEGREEDEIPVPAGEDGSDQRGLDQLGEDGARNLIEETELKTFRLALPMKTKTSREVTSTVMEMWLIEAPCGRLPRRLYPH